MYKITIDVVSDFSSNCFVTVSEMLANAGFKTPDIVSITRTGIDCNGNDEFVIVFHNRRAAEYALAFYYDEEDIEIEFIKEQVEAV